MSLTIHDGQEMIKAVRKHERILQTGSQYRSNVIVRRMCELVRNGRIGEVKRVVSIINGSSAGPGPGWKEMPVPDGFDYDMWLGPAPDAPYHIDRCLYRFRFLLDLLGWPGDEYRRARNGHRPMGSGHGRYRSSWNLNTRKGSSGHRRDISTRQTMKSRFRGTLCERN